MAIELNSSSPKMLPVYEMLEYGVEFAFGVAELR